MLKLWTFLLMLLSSVSSAQGFPVYSLLRENVYRVAHGTAFSVAWKGHTYLVTNWHVCQHFEISRTFQNETERGDTRVLRRIPEKDLCIMTPVDSKGLVIGEFLPPQHPTYTGGYPEKAHDQLHLQIGQLKDTYMVRLSIVIDADKCPLAFDDSFAKNDKTKLFEHFCTKSFTIGDTTMPGTFGCSGSPVLNSRGELVGIVNNVTDPEGDTHTLGYLPVSYLTEILKSFDP